MNSPARRRSALTTVAGVLLATVAVGITAGSATAAPGTMATTNACVNNATVTYSNLDWTLSGSVTPNTVTLGAGTVTLANASVAVNIPATILVAGYNTGVLTTGVNSIPTTVWVARQATNVQKPDLSAGTITRVDSFSVGLATTIADPDGVPGSGDETATPMVVDQPLPDWTVTPTGGNVAFSQAPAGSLGAIPIGPGGANQVVAGSVFTQSNVGLKVNFDCSPGTMIPSTPGATSGTTFTPAASISPFETVEVVAPPTAPVCSPESVSVGVSQQATIDLRNNCTDVNEAQGGGSPFVFTVGTPSVGTLTATATAGVYTYDAPATDPGAPVVVPFTATDTTTLVSTSVDISITVLANQCAATSAACSLTELVVLPVTGASMTMDKVPGQVVMAPITLNGQEQVTTGALKTITVTNARGTANGWSVTAYATDLGTAAAPTFSPILGVTVPLCSLAGAGPFAANPALAATIAGDRNCIPGDNLGWTPAAAIAHNDIPGDVALVNAGPSMAASAADWLAQLVLAGNTNDPDVGVDGLGGLLGSKTLCSAPVNQAGGTFTCNATLYLGVPASAGAGLYAGGIVLTLV